MTCGCSSTDRASVNKPVLDAVLGPRNTEVACIPVGAEPLVRAQDTATGSRSCECSRPIVFRAAEALKRPLKIPIRVNGFETVAGMVEAQLGIGLVPEGCAARYVSSGNLAILQLEEPWAVRQWNICVQDSDSLPPPVGLLLNHLSDGRA